MKSIPSTREMHLIRFHLFTFQIKKQMRSSDDIPYCYHVNRREKEYQIWEILRTPRRFIICKKWLGEINNWTRFIDILLQILFSFSIRITQYNTRSKYVPIGIYLARITRGLFQPLYIYYNIYCFYYNTCCYW